MPSHSDRAPDEERAPENQRMAAELELLDQRQSLHEKQCAERYAAFVKSVDEVKGSIGGIRDDIRVIHDRLINGPEPATQPRPAGAAGSPPDEPEHGLPFGKGWARRVAIAGLVVAILGGLGSAAQGVVNVFRAGGAAVAAFLHTLTPPPGH